MPDSGQIRDISDTALWVAVYRARESEHSLLPTAAKLKRLSMGMRLLALLPDPKGKHPDKPWGGVCVLTNRGSG
jgi:hypothetical protein